MRGKTRNLPRAIAQVAEDSLSDLSRAQTALLGALAEQPVDETLHAELVRVSGLLGTPGHQRYADALAEVMQKPENRQAYERHAVASQTTTKSGE